MQKFFARVLASLLGGGEAALRTVRGGETSLAIAETKETSAGVVCRYAPSPRVASLTVTARGEADAIVLRVDAVLQYDNGRPGAFAPENALSLPLGPAEPEAMLASRHDGPWWMYPEFPDGFAALPARTQSLLVRLGGRYLHLLPLCGDNFRCELDGAGLHLTSDTSGLYALHGDFLAVAEAGEPTAAFEKNFAAARRLGAIRVPLAAERPLPEVFSGFGFCTWDAFYRDLSSEKIYAKLDEFREKRIPVHFLILDDGWFLSRDRMLCGFKEDRTKFPEGLAAFVRRVKEEYGVPHVGVWHAFDGYWCGIDPQSPLWAAQRENLTETPAGLWMPSIDEEKAFRFWDAWHGYLAACGIDFLKVDNQSSHSAHLLGVLPTAEACRIAHRALERSAAAHFGGAMINCMGMDMENVLARPATAVSRNSDDFFPRRERGFIKHLIQNTYNALWHGALYHCDFDMWWSDHESAIQSGVLRAISGSPVYVSDELTKSRRETILPTVEDDGAVMFCDHAARPTSDRILVDCRAAGRHLCLWNRSGEALALAAFSVADGECTDAVSFGAIPALRPDADYVAYEYFTRTYTRVTAQTTLSVTLPRDGVRVWSIYPVRRDEAGEFIEMGDPAKYVPIASRHKTTRRLAELL